MAAYVAYTWSRVFLPVVLVEVMQEFRLDVGLAGLLTTVNGLGQGVLSLFAGYITDRIGYIRGLLLGMAITAATNLVIFLALTPLELFIAAASLGVGISFWTAASYPLMTRVMDGRLSLSSGMIVSSFGLGIFTAPTLATYILHTYDGWRYPFLFLTLSTSSFIPLSLALLTDRRPQASIGGVGFSRVAYSALFKFIPAIAGLAFMQFAYLALYVAYLRLAHGFKPDAAAFAISPYGLGILVGGVVGVYLSLRVRGYWMVLITSTLAMSTMLFIFNTVPSLISASLASLFLGVLLGGVMFQTLIVETQRSLPRNFLASSTGFFYMVLSFASIPPGYILGTMVSYMGWQMAGTVFYILTGILASSGTLAGYVKDRLR